MTEAIESFAYFFLLFVEIHTILELYAKVGSKEHQIQNYTYIIKCLNNFQNALPSDFELFAHKSTDILHFI